MNRLFPSVVALAMLAIPNVAAAACSTKALAGTWVIQAAMKENRYADGKRAICLVSILSSGRIGESLCYAAGPYGSTLKNFVGTLSGTIAISGSCAVDGSLVMAGKWGDDRIDVTGSAPPMGLVFSAKSDGFPALKIDAAKQW